MTTLLILTLRTRTTGPGREKHRTLAPHHKWSEYNCPLYYGPAGGWRIGHRSPRASGAHRGDILKGAEPGVEPLTGEKDSAAFTTRLSTQSLYQQYNTYHNFYERSQGCGSILKVLIVQNASIAACLLVKWLECKIRRQDTRPQITLYNDLQQVQNCTKE